MEGQAQKHQHLTSVKAASNGVQDRTGLPPSEGYLEPIFIVGQYKCGTTWLLDILSAHPQVLGVAEIDVVRAACDFAQMSDFDMTSARLAPENDRLHRFFDGSGWCAYYETSEARWVDRDVVARFDRGETIPTVPGDRSRPQMFMNLPSEAATTLYQRIKGANCPEDAMDAFLQAVCTHSEGLSHVVLKAADQVAVFDTLQAWQPEAKKIVIMRDGRDATISAIHYQKLMTEVDAPHRDLSPRDYWGQLQPWANRAQIIAQRARQGDLRVIRYEDLTYDFAGTLKPLLAWLGLDDSTSVVEAIQAQTSFEAITGRPRGKEAKHIVRKGAVGEWIGVLSKEDNAKAWEIAGEQLTAFGYTPDGSLQPLRLGEVAAISIQSLTRPVTPLVDAPLVFSCNICGQPCQAWIAELSRDGPSCKTCGSTARMRSIIHVLAVELFGKGLTLPEFPEGSTLTGIGIRDWQGYALPLAEKFNFKSIYSDKNPRCDILAIDSAFEGKVDFVLASDVLQLVPPPVSLVLEKVRRLLKPEGVFVFSAPYGKAPSTLEHFPDLHEYQILDTEGRFYLKNITKEGLVQTFDDLVFHAGTATDLEMRIFGELSLINEIVRAGFNKVKIYKADDLTYGIYWPEDWSLPIAARVS
jgi:SAM-dependent methyltransferase